MGNKNVSVHLLFFESLAGLTFSHPSLNTGNLFNSMSVAQFSLGHIEKTKGNLIPTKLFHTIYGFLKLAGVSTVESFSEPEIFDFYIGLLWPCKYTRKHF